MFKRSEKPFWQRADEKLGFHHDERTERTQLVGVRRGYFFAAILFPAVAAYQQFINEQPGVFWVMLTAVGFSLLFLLMRRFQLGDTGPADERLDQLLNRSYRLAYFMLLLALGGYMITLFVKTAGWRGPNTVAGLFWWTPAILATLLPLFATHIQQKSYNPRVWRIALMVGLIVIIVAYIVGFLAGSQNTP